MMVALLLNYPMVDQAITNSHLIAVQQGHGESVPYREAPHNIEAEQALLGAILVNNEAAHRVLGFLESQHLYEPVHGRIFEACQKLIERGQIATPVTLRTYFENDDALADVGGAQYLARLAGSAITIINAEDYGRTIYDLALRRQLIDLGEDVVNRAYDSDIDDAAIQQIEDAEQHLFRLAESGEQQGGPQAFQTSLRDAVLAAEAAHKRETQLTGVATSLNDLDELLGGLHRSDLIILAGRPAMGKSALATNIAVHAAMNYRGGRDENGDWKTDNGAVVGFFSLEMSAEQLATRILSDQTEIPSYKMRRGQLSDDEFQKLVIANQRLEEIPLFIDDTPALSIAALRTRARRLKRQNNLGLIIIDYLQLVSPSGRQRNDGRVQEISEITRGLKALAKDLDVPILALSQLSRAVEQRDDNRPQLADLRESGTIEQDSDVVMFIYREEYYWSRTHPKPKRRRDELEEDLNLRLEQWTHDYMTEGRAGEAEIIVGKHRHGPTDTVTVYFSNQFTRFGNLEAPDHLLPENTF
jgi:replicative DNA helicase